MIKEFSKTFNSQVDANEEL